MRLIISVDALRPPLTGIGRYTWEIVSRLRGEREIRQLRLFLNGRWIRRPEMLLTETGEPAAPPVRVPSRFARHAARLYWDTTCRYNVFHAPNYFLPPYARNGVITIHDLSVLKYPEMHPEPRVRMWHDEFRISLARACQVITDSESTRQEVIADLNWPDDRVTAIPLGVAATYRPRNSDELAEPMSRLGLRSGGYALCVSTLEPRKRIEILLQAYAALPAELSRRHPLVLVGGKGWLTSGIDLAIQRGVDAGWLISMGYVNESVLPLLYAGARTFVYPSIYEGFGLPIAEALASGIPVVTSNRSSMPEVAGPGSLTVDTDHADGLADALHRALTDEEWRSEAVAVGLAHASSYTWQRCVQKTMEVYRRALAN